MVHVHPEPLADHACQSWCGPPLGDEPEIQRAAGHPSHDLRGLPRVELGRPAATLARAQGGLAQSPARAPATEPAPDGPFADIECVGDLVGRIAIQQHPHGQAANLLGRQCLPWREHERNRRTFAVSLTVFI
jgi:hypothetical protein